MGGERGERGRGREGGERGERGRGKVDKKYEGGREGGEEG